MKKFIIGLLVFHTTGLSIAQKPATFNGLEMNLGNLSRLSDAKTRSISPENITGEPGKGGTTLLKNGTAKEYAQNLGDGWKVNPFVNIGPGQTYTLAEISGMGAIQHIWMTPTENWRLLTLRIFWDDEKYPSVETPLGDFFGVGWGMYVPLNSITVAVNPGNAFNCYWSMPFRKKCKITLQNLNSSEIILFYQVDYTLTEVPQDAGYFHAQFRRKKRSQGGIYTLVDSIQGKGQYVGTYIAWGTDKHSWWGEGEIKFYMDDDNKFPTIIGTGTEDYFGGSYNFEVNNRYQTFTAAYSGFHELTKPDGLFNSQSRFGMYRWHIMDPIRFEKTLRVTIQDLGWEKNYRYSIRESDISSVVFWYQAEPHRPFPKFPLKNELVNN